jgi:hypothetical protein
MTYMMIMLRVSCLMRVNGHVHVYISQEIP